MQLDLYPTAPVVGKLQPLSRFLKQRKVFVTINDATEYKRCRVQSNRKGIVLRDLAKGAAINTKKQQVCQPGDFIVAEIDAKVGGYGFIPAELDGAIVSSHYYLFEIDESQLLPQYLYYLTQSDIIQNQISSQGSTNYAAIRPKEFLAIEIPYIESDQQREIVAQLDALTQEVEALNQESANQAALLARLRQAVLREAVQGRLVPQDADDEPAAALLARIRAEKQRLVKEKKLRADKSLPPLTKAEVPYEVPEGWVWCRLGEVSQKIHYGYTASASNSLLEYRMLRITDIQNNSVQWHSVPGCEISQKTAQDYLLQEGDILIARTGGTIGKTHMIKGLDIKAVFASYLIRIVPSVNCEAEYIKFFAESPLYWQQLIAASTGTGQPNVNGTSLSGLKFPLPPLLEQRRIVAKVVELLAHCTELEAKLQQARQAAEALHAAALREAFQGMPVAVSV